MNKEYININNLYIPLERANWFWPRFIGLMGKTNINYGIIFPKCNSIHTFFMREPIDIYMTDKNYNILYIKKNMKPWRIILPKKGVYYTFEFPINKVDYKEKVKV